MLYFLVFLLINSIIFTQDFSNNQPYFDNPELGIIHEKDLFDGTETITLKPNIMNFSTSQGRYNINFIFNREYISATYSNSIEMIITICSAKVIVPYDSYQQPVKLLITDKFYTIFLDEKFSFDRRELILNINKKGHMELTLKKMLSLEEFMLIQSLFVQDREMFFAVKGLYDKITFVIPKEVVNFYRKFFYYKTIIYNN